MFHFILILFRFVSGKYLGAVPIANEQPCKWFARFFSIALIRTQCQWANEYQYEIYWWRRAQSDRRQNRRHRMMPVLWVYLRWILKKKKKTNRMTMTMTATAAAAAATAATTTPNNKRKEEKSTEWKYHIRHGIFLISCINSDRRNESRILKPTTRLRLHLPMGCRWIGWKVRERKKKRRAQEWKRRHTLLEVSLSGHRSNIHIVAHCKRIHRLFCSQMLILMLDDGAHKQ